jgi:hypothetical protein
VLGGVRGQCAEGPSSLLLVAKKIDTTKTAMMTGTTTKGEEMCMAQAPCWFQNTSRQLSDLSLQPPTLPPELLYDQPSGPALIAHDFDNLAES